MILASALAQEPETLLLDEPTTFLDLKHQFALYELLSALAKRMLVVAVTHDLNLALRFSDRVIVMENGRIAAQGPPADVFGAATYRARLRRARTTPRRLAGLTMYLRSR